MVIPNLNSTYWKWPTMKDKAALAVHTHTHTERERERERERDLCEPQQEFNCRRHSHQGGTHFCVATSSSSFGGKLQGQKLVSIPPLIFKAFKGYR